MLGSLGMQEILLLLLVVTLLFGAKKIPELARNIGRSLGEFSQGRREIEREIEAGRDATV